MDDRIDPDAWLAAQRVDQAVARRAREATVADRLAESATFVGALVELAERGDPVVLATRTGRTHRATVVTVGSDVVVLAPLSRHSARQVLVRLDAVAWLRPDQALPATGDRAGGPFDLAHLLGDLLAERAEVIVQAGGADVVRGTLRAVGADVVTVADANRQLTLCALDRVDEVTVLG